MIKFTPHRRMLCALFEPVSEAPAWKWIEDNVELGTNSELKRFDFSLVPMARWVLEQLQNPATRFFTQMICAQGGKTTTVLGFMIWMARNRPRDVAWYTDTGEKAKSDYKTKIKPFFENCRGIASVFPEDRNRRSQKLVQFESMNMHILGAESSGNRESITLFEAYCDEARKYPPGALTQIDARMKTIRNSKRVIFSSAGDEFCESHRAWMDGTRHMPFWKCPHCDHAQVFRFGQDETPIHDKRECGGFRWETNETTKPGVDTWDFKELAKTVRYECENPECRHLFSHSDKSRLMLSLEMRPTNPHADPANVSVWWWEAYMPWADCAWDRIVIKFLRAQIAAKRGDFEPLRTFVCETLGEPWRPPGGHKVEAGELQNRMGEYSVGETWKNDKAIEILTVDNQQGHIYYVRRAVVPMLGSKLIDCGVLPGFDDLRAYQLAHKINDRCVFIDCAYRPADVFEACLKHGRWVQDLRRPHPPYKGARWDGWTPLRGADFDECQFRNPSGQSIKSRWRFYDHDTQSGRSGNSRFIRLFEFSKSWFREQLFMYAVKGLQHWELPKNVSPDYLKQMQNVERRELLDINGQVTGHEWHEKGRHDYPDAEQMFQAVCAIAELA